MALDFIPVAPTPSSPQPTAGAAGALKAPSNTTKSTSHNSTAAASDRASADPSANTAGKTSGQDSAGGPDHRSTTGSSQASTTTKPNSASGKDAASAQAAGAPASATDRAASQTQNGAETNFLQALAQSQAAAKNDASAAAGAPSAAPAEPAGGKSKPGSAADSDAVATALSLVSQSLAAAMAGQQPATPVPSAKVATASQEDSTGAISLARGSSSAGILSLLTNDGADGQKSPDAGTLTAAAPAADANSTSATALQAAQMSAGSHFNIQHKAGDPDTATDDLRAPVGTPAFNDELGGKLTWMAHRGVESGSLQLSPEHLGPLEVRISVRDGAASVWFGANHADTRAALEQALPHLRNMFASQGLTLSDAGVSRESPRGQAQKPAVAAISSTTGVGDAPASIVSVSTRLPGLLDTYA
ncbi:MAG: hypothetical protein JWN85_2753 [Gammaproteobacteria bacterium]|nr:hypothetical protein [Gammaproteobacteria bacterium]